MLSIKEIRCDVQANPHSPRFSWTIGADGKDVCQRAYTLQVSRDKEFSGLVMDSGRQESSQSIFVDYRGGDLLPSTPYWYRVRVEDNRGESSSWSSPVSFETGLLLCYPDRLWPAPFISPADERKSRRSPGWYLDRSVEVDKPLASARIYATALGLYELLINDRPAGDNVLAPGWTNYDKRLLYQSYDITDLLTDGSNRIRGHIGAGWYKGDLMGGRSFFGKRNAFSAVIYLTFADGEERRILSDQTWTSRPSPVLFSEIYHGETYDARLEAPTGEGDRIAARGPRMSRRLPPRRQRTRGVDILTVDPAIVTAQDGPLIRRQEILPVREVIRTPKGETVLDFGQNLSGWVRFRVRGEAGGRVRLKHGEVLDKDGNFYTKNLRKARQEVTYILKGDGVEIFEPHFTFQGFRYARVLEWPGGLEGISADDFEAVVVHSELDSRGTFACSSDKVNRLHRNIEWGMKGNFLDIPTDCPQRDERLGWTGDAQAFIGTAQFLRNTDGFYRKWLRDLASEQRSDGGIPHVIPDVLARKERRNILDPFNPFHSSAGWSDAAVICPWEAYCSSGDRLFLEEQFETMKRWIGWIEDHSDEGLIWRKGHQYGDWLALDRKNERRCEGATPQDLVATAFYANSVDITARTAELLGADEDGQYYEDLHHRIIEAFQARFITADGQLRASTQTAQILALQFNLVPDELRRGITDDLVALIEETGHLTTGFLGTPFLNRVLAAEGRNDIAGRLLLREEYPSWLYPISKGATTIWESWNSINPDGSFNRLAMNSFNHYAFGVVGQYLYDTVAGISVLEPGYKSFRIKPHPGEGLIHAVATVESPYGRILVQWQLRDRRLTLNVTIPVNTTAEVYRPVGPGRFSDEVLLLGSGDYQWVLEYPDGGAAV